MTSAREGYHTCDWRDHAKDYVDNSGVPVLHVNQKALHATVTNNSDRVGLAKVT